MLVLKFGESARARATLKRLKQHWTREGVGYLGGGFDPEKSEGDGEEPVIAAALGASLGGADMI